MAPQTPLAAVSNRFYVACKALSSIKEKRVVSKPQILSRLRYVDIVRLKDETEEELAYRTKYEALQAWNNNYWAENNELFNREKEEYIRKNFGPNAKQEEALSHDQLAPFYRIFLEKNRAKHVDYNTIWYKNHLSLIFDSIRAKFSRFKIILIQNNEESCDRNPDGSSRPNK